MTPLEIQLQNPVWFSLAETHKKFAIEYDGVRFYHPEVCPFGAFLDESKTVNASNEYLKTTDSFFYVSEHKIPEIDGSKVSLVRKIDGCQMVLAQQTNVPITEEIILLDETYMDDIYDLVWLVMPGYYKKRTFEMGKYYGIIKEGQLVSIAGQRMQTNLFIEVSAVVTHPDHTRKGLAGQLITYNTSEILKENKLPILHTTKGNPAISLYEKLGYELTRDMNWWLYRRNNSE